MFLQKMLCLQGLSSPHKVSVNQHSQWQGLHPLGFHMVEKLIAVVKLTCNVHGEEERDAKSCGFFLNLLTYLRRFLPDLTVYSES